MPLPCAMVLASPWLDLTCSGGAYVVNQAHDPLLQKSKLLETAGWYLKGASASAPENSPLFMTQETTAAMPPTLIHVGDKEIVLDDSRHLHQELMNAGREVELREFRRAALGCACARARARDRHTSGA